MSAVYDDTARRKLLNRRLLLQNIYALGDPAGKIDVVEFLRLTWDIETMPSTDGRFTTAAGDVWQHMVNNTDWEYPYLFGTYLAVLDGPDDTFYRFLESLVNPLARPPAEQDTYVTLINRHLAGEGVQLQLSDDFAGTLLYRMVRRDRGVTTPAMNLIFASTGPKPRIVLTDAVSNTLRIVEHADKCLLYERPIPTDGILWSDLVEWWADRSHQPVSPAVEQALLQRLGAALSADSPPERLLFDTYYSVVRAQFGASLPALIPQVYLHYDPYTIRELAGASALVRQRMDFLLLLPAGTRVVLELDGRQHYAEQDTTKKGAPVFVASPKKYAEMVAADRALRLAGYELYRFGGYELQTEAGARLLGDFFTALFHRHQVTTQH